MEKARKAIDKTKPSFPILLDFEDELKYIWGKQWGAQSEIGKLHEVMVQKPGPEMAPPKEALRWYGIRNEVFAEKAVQQHQRFVDIMKQEKVTVHYMNAPPDAKGAYDLLQRIWATRDPGFVVNGGAIVNRMSLPWRRGDELWWTKRVTELGCPILYTVRGRGTFESGNVVWLDPTHVCIGRSMRTNQDGIDQVATVLKSVGVEEIKVVPIPGWLENIQWPAGGFAHLDCVFAYVDAGLAMVYPPAVPFDFLEYLKGKNIKMIEVPPDEGKDFACNVLVLEPRKIIMLDGFPTSRKKLEEEGVDVITVDMSEFIKSGGGPHCASAPLTRDPGPTL